MPVTERVAGDNYQGRDVPLLSHHDGGYTRLEVRASREGGHATIGFDAFWKSARISMTLPELEQVRDAINAVLVEAAS